MGSRNGVPVRATLKISILWGSNNRPVRKLITCRDKIVSFHGKEPRFLPKTPPIEWCTLLMIRLIQSLLCCSPNYCSWAATNHPFTLKYYTESPFRVCVSSIMHLHKWWESQYHSPCGTVHFTSADETSAKYLWIYHQYCIFPAATPNMWGCSAHHVRFCNNQYVRKGCRMHRAHSTPHWHNSVQTQGVAMSSVCPSVGCTLLEFRTTR